MVKKRDKVYINGVKDVYTKEDGKKIWYMVLENMNGQMVG
jgi:hypothetical protein